MGNCLAAENWLCCQTAKKSGQSLVNDIEIWLQLEPEISNRGILQACDQKIPCPPLAVMSEAGRGMGSWDKKESEEKTDVKKDDENTGTGALP